MRKPNPTIELQILSVVFQVVFPILEKLTGNTLKGKREIC